MCNNVVNGLKDETLHVQKVGGAYNSGMYTVDNLHCLGSTEGERFKFKKVELASYESHRFKLLNNKVDLDAMKPGDSVKLDFVLYPCRSDEEICFGSVVAVCDKRTHEHNGIEKKVLSIPCFVDHVSYRDEQCDSSGSNETSATNSIHKRLVLVLQFGHDDEKYDGYCYLYHRDSQIKPS